MRVCRTKFESVTVLKCLLTTFTLSLCLPLSLSLSRSLSPSRKLHHTQLHRGVVHLHTSCEGRCVGFTHLNGPPFMPMDGSSLASRMDHTRPTKNQLLEKKNRRNEIKNETRGKDNTDDEDRGVSNTVAHARRHVPMPVAVK